MNTKNLKSKIRVAGVAFSLLFGIGILSATTANAQYDRRNDDRNDRRNDRPYDRPPRRRTARLAVHLHPQTLGDDQGGRIGDDSLGIFGAGHGNEPRHTGR